MTTEALFDLLEAVEAAIKSGDWKVDGACDPDLVIRRAKKALAQQEQEPDYWLGYGLQAHTEKPFEDATPLYTTPPQRKPLTDEQKDAARYRFFRNYAHMEQAQNAWRYAMTNRAEAMDDYIDRAIKAAHGITTKAKP